MVSVKLLCKHRNGDYAYPLPCMVFIRLLLTLDANCYDVNLNLLHAHEKDADHSILAFIQPRLINGHY